MVAQSSNSYRIARVRFQNDDGGAILVGRLLSEEGRAGDTKVLRVPQSLARKGRPFHEAQTITLRGYSSVWHNPRTGESEKQLVVTEWFEARPRGAGWIDYVAGSPAFKGIGRSTATRIWDQFGADLFEVLAAGDPAPVLAAVPELGPDRADILIGAWAASGDENLVRWLDERSLPRRLSIPILKAYADQEQAVSRLDADPYRLISFGMSWDVVDALARNAFHVRHDDFRRFHAAVVQVLMTEYGAGHTAATAAVLNTGIMRLLQCDEHQAAAALRQVYFDGGFVQVDDDLFQLRGVHVMERSIATDLGRRCNVASQSELDLGLEAAVDHFEAHGAVPMRLTGRQREAVGHAFCRPLSIIVGGAGTGKTACLAALHHSVERLHGNRDGVLQMALAGRAAKRMREATNRDAFTIAGFLHTVDQARIDRATHIVIDEASMLDVPSFYAVLRRLRGKKNVVLVGDDFQLQPVGSGKILHLLAHRNGIPITMLDRVWRQEEGNSIRTVATDVRSGIVPALPVFRGVDDGVSILEAGSEVALTVARVFEDLGGLADPEQVCVITPRRRTGIGNSLAVNTAIHRAKKQVGYPIVGGHGDTGFNTGDRFVCDVNHWDVDLMNGSLGTILRRADTSEVDGAGIVSKVNGLPGSPPIALVNVDGVERLLTEQHLLDCSWGYALTCHRAQGSDFDRVVVILDDRTDSSWLYTALTRGRRQVVLIGTTEQVRRIVATRPRVDSRRVALDTLLSQHLPGRRNSVSG